MNVLRYAGWWSVGTSKVNLAQIVLACHLAALACRYLQIFVARRKMDDLLPEWKSSPYMKASYFGPPCSTSRHICSDLLEANSTSLCCYLPFGREMQTETCVSQIILCVLVRVCMTSCGRSGSKLVRTKEDIRIQHEGWPILLLYFRGCCCCCTTWWSWQSEDSGAAKRETTATKLVEILHTCSVRLNRMYERRKIKHERNEKKDDRL